MNDTHSLKIVIVGGGTSGWMTACALSAFLPNNGYDIKLIESDQIGTVGVGEATIPPIRDFNRLVGIDEAEFVMKTGATFKLGIEFHNWKVDGEYYFHPFGVYGKQIDSLPFHQYWLREKLNGGTIPLGDFSLCEVMARSKKFATPTDDPKSFLSTTGYAFHLDAGLYAKFLREKSEAKGVKRIEGKITEVTQRDSDGFIESVSLESKEKIIGDLFIDCSGFRGLLIEETLKTGYENWSNFLPCDRALAIPTENFGKPRPYTMSIAHTAGWQWRIPLQHRTGNGHVYCSKYISDDEATSTLLSNLEGEPLSEPRPLKFVTGKRKKFWNKNCIAIGLSAGFMEPLESTSIHLIQESISQLLKLLPGKEFDQAEINEFNKINDMHYELIRDFLILHYYVNQREETFWKNCQNMEIPESLKQRIALYKNRGRIYVEKDNLFKLDSWLAVMHGQGLTPKSYDPMTEKKDKEKVSDYMSRLRSAFIKETETMSTHDKFIKRYCKSSFV